MARWRRRRQRKTSGRCCTAESPAGTARRAQTETWAVDDGPIETRCERFVVREAVSPFCLCHDSLSSFAVLREGDLPEPSGPLVVVVHLVSRHQGGWEAVVVVWALMSALTSGMSRPLRRSLGPLKPYLDSTAHIPPKRVHRNPKACLPHEEGSGVVSALPDSGQQIAGGSL